MPGPCRAAAMDSRGRRRPCRSTESRDARSASPTSARSASSPRGAFRLSRVVSWMNSFASAKSSTRVVVCRTKHDLQQCLFRKQPGGGSTSRTTFPAPRRVGCWLGHAPPTCTLYSKQYVREGLGLIEGTGRTGCEVKC